MSHLPQIVVVVALTSFASVAWSQGPCCPAWTAESDQVGALMGDAVSSAGDVNGDGFDDVLVGAGAYTHDQPYEGRAFVYLGSAAGLATAPVWTAELDQAAAFARSVAGVGDVNGDGFDDVLVGAAGYSNGQSNEGGAFLYLGSPTGPSVAPDWSAESDQASAGFGSAVAGAGDVNGDGFDDVLVAARDFHHGQTYEGRAFLYLGSAAGLAASPAWTFESDQASAFLGSVAGAGDVNGDGFDDVLVAAPDFDSLYQNVGRVWLFLGSAAGLATSPAWIADRNDSSELGTALASADVNGDGFSDVVLGGLVDRYVGPNLDLYGSGRALLYLGSAAGLATSPSWTVDLDQGDTYYGYEGIALASAGDVNGDGYGDLVIGTFGFETTLAVVDEGKAYVYLGSAVGLPARAIWSVEGNAQGRHLGEAVAGAGDVDGDGFDDVLVGAPRFSGPETWEGRAYEYAGSAGFVSSAVFAGDGIDADRIEPVNAVVGELWSAPLTIGHPHGAGGPLSLMVRGATLNGPNFPSPVGGRLTELLVGGPALATLSGSHDGVKGDVPVQPIPNQVALLGVPWAAQYIVVGGGFGDLSQAVYGVVGCR